MDPVALLVGVHNLASVSERCATILQGSVAQSGLTGASNGSGS